MTIWFSSDLHFGHNKDFIYEARGFKNIEEHDETIIENWNSVVEPCDDVYLLGDLMLGEQDVGIENLVSLNGNIHTIIIGNHDTQNKIQLYIEELNPTYVVYADMLKAGKWRFYMSHYPTVVSNYDDAISHKPTVNLFGHTHQKNKFYNNNPYMYNVGLDAHKCFPVNLDQIKDDIRYHVQNNKML